MMRNRVITLAVIAAALGGVVFWLLPRDEAAYGDASLEEVRSSLIETRASASSGEPMAILNMAGKVYNPEGVFCQDGTPGQFLGHAGTPDSQPLLDLRYFDPASDGIPPDLPLNISFLRNGGDEAWRLAAGEVIRENGVFYADGMLSAYWFANDADDGAGEVMHGEPVPFAVVLACQ